MTQKIKIYAIHNKKTGQIGSKGTWHDTLAEYWYKPGPAKCNLTKTKKSYDSLILSLTNPTGYILSNLNWYQQKAATLEEYVHNAEIVEIELTITQITPI